MATFKDVIIHVFNNKLVRHFKLYLSHTLEIIASLSFMVELS